jgi:hypothetical protein
MYRPYNRNTLHMERKTKVIPVNRGIWSHLTIRQYLSNILGEHEIKNCKKRSYLASAYILQNVK